MEEKKMKLTNNYMEIKRLSKGVIYLFLLSITFQKRLKNYRLFKMSGNDA